MQTLRVSEQEAGMRFDRFLGKYFPLAPKSFLYKMLRKKNIKLNGKRAGGNEKLSIGDEIALYLSDQTIESFRVLKNQGEIPREKIWTPDIVFEDENVLVVNKPAGMLSQKANRDDISLVEHLSQYLKAGEAYRDSAVFEPGICNRLDRNTSGLVVAGKTVHGLQWMNRLFAARDLKKYYLCIVCGSVKRGSLIRGYLWKDEKQNKVTILDHPRSGADRIETEYEPLEQLYFGEREYTLLRVHLITGKSHQIRAHLQSIGHPVAGDVKYGSASVSRELRQAFGLRHQLLHAWRLELGSPEYLPDQYHGMVWEAEIPEKMREIKLQCEKNF